MKKSTLAASLLVALALSACAGQSAQVASSTTSGSNRPSSSSSSSSTPEDLETASDDTPSSDSTDGLELKFGQTAKFDDGVEITVSKPKLFTPSEFAAAKKMPHYVRFTVTLVNGGTKAFEPVAVTATIQSANGEGDSVFDTDKGLEGGPNTKILKGREAKWDIGFGVEDPKDLVLELSPGFEYNSVIFTS